MFLNPETNTEDVPEGHAVQATDELLICTALIAVFAVSASIRQELSPDKYK